MGWRPAGENRAHAEVVCLFDCLAGLAVGGFLANTENHELGRPEHSYTHLAHQATVIQVVLGYGAAVTADAPGRNVWGRQWRLPDVSDSRFSGSLAVQVMTSIHLLTFMEHHQRSATALSSLVISFSNCQLPPLCSTCCCQLASRC